MGWGGGGISDIKRTEVLSYLLGVKKAVLVPPLLPAPSFLYGIPPAEGVCALLPRGREGGALSSSGRSAPQVYFLDVLDITRTRVIQPILYYRKLLICSELSTIVNSEHCLFKDSPNVWTQDSNLRMSFT